MSTRKEAGRSCLSLKLFEKLPLGIYPDFMERVTALNFRRRIIIKFYRGKKPVIGENLFKPVQLIAP